MRNKLIGIFSVVLGSLFLVGCIYNAVINILIAIELNDKSFAFGSVLGASIIGLLGILLIKHGFKKYNTLNGGIST